MDDDPVVDDVAGAILDCTRVDWASAQERSASSVDVLKNLGLVAQVVEVHRAAHRRQRRRPGSRPRSWWHSGRSSVRNQEPTGAAMAVPPAVTIRPVVQAVAAGVSRLPQRHRCRSSL